MPFETLAAMYEAFYLGRCAAVTQDSTSLASSIVRQRTGGRLSHAARHPLQRAAGSFLRAGDQIWLDVVRWTHYAMLSAEEHGVTSTNVDARKKASDDPAVRRLLGVVPGNGKALKSRRGLGLPHHQAGRELRRELRSQLRLAVAAQVRSRHQRPVGQGRRALHAAVASTSYCQPSRPKI